jgi:hypothetical protein
MISGTVNANLEATLPVEIEAPNGQRITVTAVIDTGGSRRRKPEDLRRYVLEHVLLHEIGHHIQYMQRSRAGFMRRLSHRAGEQFAEDYALRHLRRQPSSRSRRLPR